MSEIVSGILAAANRIQSDLARPPRRPSKPANEGLVDSSLVEGTRLAFLSAVIDQINGPFEHKWYDATSVMLRRLIETLIIEAYFKQGMASKIKDDNGDFLPLADLVVCARKESAFNLSRNTKRLLTQLKKLGDLSAHNKSFNAKRSYMENLADEFYLDLQTLIREFVNLAK